MRAARLERVTHGLKVSKPTKKNKGEQQGCNAEYNTQNAELFEVWSTDEESKPFRLLKANTKKDALDFVSHWLALEIQATANRRSYFSRCQNAAHVEFIATRARYPLGSQCDAEHSLTEMPLGALLLGLT